MIDPQLINQNGFSSSLNKTQSEKYVLQSNDYMLMTVAVHVALLELLVSEQHNHIYVRFVCMDFLTQTTHISFIDIFSVILTFL